MTTSPIAHNERLHSMDALRAVAMLLGIVLHAEMAYMNDVWSVWPADDPSSSGIFDLSFWFIHLFRMQVFFVMAGFFACMLYGRYGAERFSIHRLKRIALPLLLAMIFIIPIWKGVFAWGHHLMTTDAESMSFFAVWANYYKALDINSILHPVHLWFLQQLLVMYAAAVVWLWFGKVAPPIARLNALVTNSWCWCIRKGLAAPVFAILAFPLLFLQNGSGVETQSTFWPALHIVAYYMVFFAGGWMLYRQRDLLPSLSRFYIPLLIIAFALGAWMIARLGDSSLNDADTNILTRAISASSTGAFVIGFTGLFLHLFQKPSRVMRYISDSTYWMYIIHLPLVVWLNQLLMPVPLNAYAKFSIVMIVSGVIMLGTYQLFVRYTWIGVLLNGPRLREERKAKRDEKRELSAEIPSSSPA